MSEKKKKSITEEQTVESSLQAFLNVEKETVIKDALLSMGYDDQTLAIGRSLCTNAQSLLGESREAISKTKIAADKYDVAYEDLKSSYMHCRRIARLCFQKRSAYYELLELRGKLPSSQTGMIFTMTSFFKYATSEEGIVTAFASKNISIEELQSLHTKCTEVTELRAESKHVYGMQQVKTAEKQEVIRNLKKWMSKFYEAAKIALEDQPQLLEVLGIVVKG